MLKCSENSSWLSLNSVFNLLEYVSYLYLSKYTKPRDKIASASSTVPSPNIEHLDTLDSLIKAKHSDTNAKGIKN